MSPLEKIMQVAEGLFEERKEVEFVLRSGALHRAPGLEQLFIYITTKFFEGTADDLKEYTIAVEAFGRPPILTKGATQSLECRRAVSVSG